MFSKFQIGHLGNPKIYDFDIFSTCQIEHPENYKFHYSDMFSTFSNGHPETSKIYNFDHFSHFPVSRSLTDWDNTIQDQKVVSVFMGAFTSTLFLETAWTAVDS